MEEIFDRMSYEILVREGLQCERFDYEGANADVFDSLLMKQSQYNKDPTAQNYFELGLKMGKVITWMSDAIQKLHDRYNENDSIREELNECMAILSEPSMENIEIAGLRASQAIGLI